MIPRAYAGASDGGQIYLLDEGTTDAGAPILVRAQTAPLAPDGTSADHIFDWLRITLTYTMGTVVTVTPIVDGVDLDSFDIVLLPKPERVSEVFERMIRATEMRGGVPIRTYAPRGTWLSVRLEAEVAGGDLIVDSIDLDYSSLTPTKQRV